MLPYLKTLFCIFYLFFESVLYAAPPMFVFKASEEPPEEVFQNGLNSQGTNENFIQHISGNLWENNTDGFVSTIGYWRYIDQLMRYVLNAAYNEHHIPLASYVYTIRATNNFYSSEITLEHLASLDPCPINSMNNRELEYSLLQRESEYITPVHIASELIQEADTYIIDANGIITVRHQYNPNYVPGSSHANPGPYLGSDTLPPQNISMPPVAGIPPVTAYLLPDGGANEHFAPYLLYMLNNLVEEQRPSSF